MELVKDGMVIVLNDDSTAKMYLNLGWKKVKNAEVVKETIATGIELTKKQIQSKLDELKVDYKPQENKSTLLDKLKTASPTDDFDDGLLKG
jgi:hypothetical protein